MGLLSLRGQLYRATLSLNAILPKSEGHVVPLFAYIFLLTGRIGPMMSTTEVR